MKIKDTYTYQIPSYALSALFNSDYSGLDDDDITNIKNFQKRTSHIDVFDDKYPDQEPYFSNSPEFGLATNVVDIAGLEFKK